MTPTRPHGSSACLVDGSELPAPGVPTPSSTGDGRTGKGSLIEDGLDRQVVPVGLAGPPSGAANAVAGIPMHALVVGPDRPTPGDRLPKGALT